MSESLQSRQSLQSKELFKHSQMTSPGGVHSPVRAFKSVGGAPIFFDRAEGAYLHCVDGFDYVDFCMSFGPMILGHRDPDVQEVVNKAVKDVWSLGACEPYSLELAQWMIKKIPWVEKLRFVSSGTEAVMSALRLARGATGRSLILKFEGCYHGHVDSMLVQAGSGLAGLSASSSAGVCEQVASQTLVAPLDNEEKLDEIFNHHGANIAAVILEPLPANFGLLEQRKEFIHHVVHTARRHGSLVIFDEVISGFRVALGGMAEQLNIQPDLLTYGKIIGGGMPVGCYAGRRDLMEHIAPSGDVYQAGTLSAFPIGMRAGLATVKKIEKENVIPLLEERTQNFCRSLNGIFKEQDTRLEVRHYGSLFWIHSQTADPIRCVSQIPKDQSEKFKSFFHKLLKAGIYLGPSGYEVCFMSWAHSPKILDQCLEKIRGALL